MKVFFNGWFEGFLNNTNPGLNVNFFINLLKKVFKSDIYIGNIDDSDILFEFVMLINTTTKLNHKKWKYTFMMSGESYSNKYQNNYDCVLFGERNNKNIINLPLFIPYVYSNNFLNTLENQNKRLDFPKKDVVVFISNNKGLFRNKFLENLEKKMHITYAGTYKNNIGKYFDKPYNSNEFKDFISQFKFVISMENSRQETYITEKIIHGMLSKTIPVYWGSKRVKDYFNKNRFIEVQDENDINNTIEKMHKIKNNENEWFKIVNQNVFSENKLKRTIDIIARDIRRMLFPQKWKNISQIYILSNPEFEPERYKRLNKVFFEDIKLSKDLISFISPTYKHLITNENMKKYVKKDLVLNVRPNPMKKSEISLFLNYKEVLKDINKNYKDGMFIIFESDVQPLSNISNINTFFDYVSTKQDRWDLIHFGGEGKDIWKHPHCFYTLPYRTLNQYPKKLLEFAKTNIIEDITNKTSPVRLTRHFHTRCTDSILYTFKGCEKMFNYFIQDKNYGAPMDYYFIDKLENNLDFKHYWSDPTYFLQRSNCKLEKSTIQ